MSQTIHKPWARATDDEDQPPTIAPAIEKWWEDLEEDRGGRAALRRCRTLDEALYQPAFHALFRVALKFQADHKDAFTSWWGDPLRWAAVATLAAAIKKDERGGFGTQMARPAGDRRALSEVRLRRFLTTDETTAGSPQDAREEAWRHARRIITQLGGAVDLIDVAHGLFDWTPGVRRRWALAWYAAASTAA